MTYSASEFMASVPRSVTASDAWAEGYGAELRGIVTRYASRLPRSVQRHLGPSEIGHACDRQVVAKMAGSKVTNHVADPWASIVGTAVHSFLADAFDWDNTHNAYLRWLTEARVTPDPGPDPHPGTADLYDAFNRAVVDHKGIATNTLIPIPSGWTTMSELREGDEVFGADGRVCRVVKAYPVQYRDCYRVRFKTGELVTDDVQEFTLYRNRGSGHDTRNPERVTLAAAEMRRQLRARSGQRHLRVPCADPLELPEAVLPVHPYVLGCWLGDGETASGILFSGEEELFRHVRECGYVLGRNLDKRGYWRYRVPGLTVALRQLGVLGDKRIPDLYLRASFEQRLSLLRGLMDTDGSHNKTRNQCVFTTTDKQLAYQVHELAASLSWKAYVCSFPATGFGVTTTAYQVVFTPVGHNPFRLTRKAQLVHPKTVAGAAYRIVQEVEPTLTVPTRCIDVDSPDHLYLATKDFLPVHNCQGDSTRSKLRREGPPRHYYVQLLLYRRGYLNLGLPVERVVIASWPRTKSTLDDMYVWSHVPTPADDQLVEDVLVQTAFRQQLAELVTRGEFSLMDVPAVPDDDECYFCLAGDTEVVTRLGLRKIRELSGTSTELLVPAVTGTGRRNSRGTFQRVPVRPFGEQELLKVTLTDRRAEKTVLATREHNWFVTDRMRVRRNGARVVRHQWRKTTAELSPGDLLQPLRRAITSEPDMMPVAVAQGFAFGDGTSSYNDAHERPASLTVYSNGKGEALLKFFDGFSRSAQQGNTFVYGLPRFWKRLPPLDESRSFLLSWLAGYFAADGCVSDAGACAIASADRENLEFTRSLAAACGIGYRPIGVHPRVGIHAVAATDLYDLPLRRRDLPSWFFLVDAHRERVEAANTRPGRETYWKVKSVEATGRTEPVYCAVTGEAEAFGLSDDLMTGNCHLYRPQSQYDGLYGCPGTLLGKKAADRKRS